MDYKLLLKDIKEELMLVDFDLDYLFEKRSINKNDDLLGMLTMNDLSEALSIEDEMPLSVVFNKLLRDKAMGTPDIYNITKDHPSVYNKITSGVTKTPASDTLLKIAIVCKCSEKETIDLYESAKNIITTKKEKVVLAFIRLKIHEIEKNIYHVMENIDYILEELDEDTLFSTK